MKITRKQLRQIIKEELSRSITIEGSRKTQAGGKQRFAVEKARHLIDKDEPVLTDSLLADFDAAIEHMNKVDRTRNGPKASYWNDLKAWLQGKPDVWDSKIVNDFVDRFGNKK